MTSLFESALRCENHSSRPPVWLMRQAGRYMPSYQALRKKHSLNKLFHTPELAVDITLLPEEELGVDALILFSDILVVTELFGCDLDFVEGKGPQVTPQLKKLPDALPIDKLSYVFETIKGIKECSSTPLIGFCGGPFTITTYMMPEPTEEAIEKITDATIDYLKAQIEAGVQAVQIFDSWASKLAYADFLRYCWKPMKRIVDALAPTGVPVIIFCRGSSLRARELSQIGPRAISFDWHRPLPQLRNRVNSTLAIQGNLNPDILLHGSKKDVEKRVREMLDGMRGDPGFIANLGHGVLPGTPYENVKTFVDAVKYYS